MERRLQLVREYLSGLYSMTELRPWGQSENGLQVDGAVCVAWECCRRVGRWLAAAHKSPTATDAAIMEALLTLRRRYPRRGPKKLLKMLATQQPTWVLRSRTTVSDI